MYTKYYLFYKKKKHHYPLKIKIPNLNRADFVGEQQTQRPGKGRGPGRFQKNKVKFDPYQVDYKTVLNKLNALLYRVNN